MAIRDDSTIVARATPPGEGGLAVVRLSGPRARSVASAVFRRRDGSAAAWRDRMIVYGILLSGGGQESPQDNELEIIDEAMAVFLPGPATYTGEDTVEIFCHGGLMPAALAVEACRAAGAESARPGEFTRRAFLNGKLSLDRAEAVADLIQAETGPAARAAVRQMRGGLDSRLARLEKPLLDLLAEVEGSLEFVEEEVPGPSHETVAAALEAAVADIDALLALAPAGRLLREGVHVVLAGAPNAGKSSLFNLLLDDDRALVDPEAGTTRDVVVARVQRRSGLYVLHDTAGLREAPGRVERMGVDRARRAVTEADVVLAIDDGSSGEAVLPGDTSAPVVRVRTKRDLDPGAPLSAGVVATSSVTGSGRDEVWSALENAAEVYRLREAVEQGVALNDRHVGQLETCRTELVELQRLMETSDPGLEIVGTMLATVAGSLGEISGRVFSEQILGAVFDRFCVGK